MVQQYNYPTTILYGPGAVAELARAARRRRRDRRSCSSPTPAWSRPAWPSACAAAAGRRRAARSSCSTDVHPNPIEEDVEKGVRGRSAAIGAAGLIALGGGSPMDVAKAIAVLATHAGPLSRFDDAKGGDKHITQPGAAGLRDPHHGGHGQRGRPLGRDHHARHRHQDGDLPPVADAEDRRPRSRADRGPAARPDRGHRLRRLHARPRGVPRQGLPSDRRRRGDGLHGAGRGRAAARGGRGDDLEARGAHAARRQHGRHRLPEGPGRDPLPGPPALHALRHPPRPGQRAADADGAGLAARGEGRRVHGRPARPLPARGAPVPRARPGPARGPAGGGHGVPHADRDRRHAAASAGSGARTSRSWRARPTPIPVTRAQSDPLSPRRTSPPCTSAVSDPPSASSSAAR